MLAAGRARVEQRGLRDRIELREGRAETLPFGDAEFDALTFTYLLRYVDDVPATLRELARVVRPGGTIAMLEFGLPRGVWRPLWELVCASRAAGGGGDRLPGLGRGRPLPRPEHPRLLGAVAGAAPARAWREAGIDRGSRAPAQPRRRHRRLGRARVTAARPRPAFYALRQGGWRDYVTLLHPPYTLWHLSYVAVGAALAPRMDWALLGWTTLAFVLAMGVGAHALDELQGRPLQTRIPAADARGPRGRLDRGRLRDRHRRRDLASTLWLLAFVAVGAFLVVAYNLELFGGAFHGGLWFPAAWGAFPVLTAYFASAERSGPRQFAAAAFAFARRAWAQRRLSTPVRLVRRRVVAVEGTAELDDGTTLPLDADALAAVPEAALKALVAATVLIAAALLLFRAG